MGFKQETVGRKWKRILSPYTC